MYLYGAAALGAVLIVTGYTAYVYHLGGVGPKAELAALVSSYKAAQTVHEAEDQRKETASTNVILQKEAENAKIATVTAAAWKSYSDGLRRTGSQGSANQGQKPTTTTTVSACNDDSGNKVVLAAVQEYQRSTRQGIDGFRLEVAKQLEQADKQTGQLITLRGEVAGLAAVNAQVK
jgi:hypothetical protein